MKPEKILYTAQATATGGRDGRALSSTQSLDVQLSTPTELGGAGGKGTNPEELFAAGYAACFIGALKVTAMREKVKLPNDVAITGEVGIGPAGSAFSIAVELKVSAPGVDSGLLRQLVEKAHQVCPYSNATRNNIDVKLIVV